MRNVSSANYGTEHASPTSNMSLCECSNVHLGPGQQWKDKGFHKEGTLQLTPAEDSLKEELMTKSKSRATD
ncbi:hypothetical protein ABBQ38_011004 [Trebouxia sp. C0009 RCD-2024]